MPKMKTNSSAKKRFKLTGTGKIKRNRAYMRHIMDAKTKKQKRRLNVAGTICAADEPRVKAMLCIGK